jgi:xanthine/uracil permease
MSENLQNIWIVGSAHTLVIVAILQIVDLALTLLHSLQERKGQLWRYFGAIAGVKIPDGFGEISFFGGLTISLWIVGVLGIAGTVLWQTPLAFGCLGAIIGCRLSDGWFSHIALNNAGYRPNPGLSSVPLYFAEVVVLLVVFYPTIRMQTLPVLIGFIIGALAFYTVIPSLRSVGRLVFEPIEPWQKGTPQPKW